MTPELEAKFKERFSAEEAENEDPRFKERLAAEKQAVQDKLINPVNAAGAGVFAGWGLAPFIQAFEAGAGLDPAKLAKEFNIPAEVIAKGENAVMNYIKAMHVGDVNYVGGESYKEAHALTEKAKEMARNAPAGFKYDPAAQQYIPESEYETRAAARAEAERKRVAAERKKLPLTTKIVQKSPIVGRGMLGTENVLRKGFGYAPLNRAVIGAYGGYNAAEAYNRGVQGDLPGAAASGAGALGALSTLAKSPKARALGLLGMGTSAAVDAFRDSPTIGHPGAEQTIESAKNLGKSIMQGFAGGGPAGYAKGKKVIEGGLSLAKKFGYDPKKVAANYPEVVPPVLTTDKKTGKSFLQKELGPEAMAVQRARKAAQAEIDAGQMTSPYFDITQRAYVNPSNYPLQGRTLTDVVPKKAATVAKYEEMASDPAATQRLMEAYNKGKDRPLAKDWYAMKQLEDKFIEELGPEAGRNAFRSRFAEPMAATTGGADPNSNLMMVAYTNMMREKGLPIPENAYELPFPIGGRYVSGNMDQARKYHQLGSIPIDNPKRHNFASNFMGYRDRPTIDEQMMGLFAPGKGAPEAGTYGVYEAQLNKLAQEAGVNPVNFQDVAWAGAKDYPGKPMMQEINEMIYRTGRITGEDPETILKGYIRGNKPMYGITGLGALGLQDTGGVNNPE